MEAPKCKDCLWFDRCVEQEVVCEYYYPTSDDEVSALESAMYIADLDERHAIYQELVKEQQEE